VKELLVVSQDTSAYGVDVKYRTGFWDGQPVKTRCWTCATRLGRPGRAPRRLGAAALRLPYPHVDECCR
jgi:ribosomal protein S12 methylthiotransferase